MSDATASSNTANTVTRSFSNQDVLNLQRNLFSFIKWCFKHKFHYIEKPILRPNSRQNCWPNNALLHNKLKLEWSHMPQLPQIPPILKQEAAATKMWRRFSMRNLFSFLKWCHMWKFNYIHHSRKTFLKPNSRQNGWPNDELISPSKITPLTKRYHSFSRCRHHHKGGQNPVNLCPNARTSYRKAVHKTKIQE